MRPVALATAIAVLATVGPLALLSGCRKARPPTPPPPEVTVLTVRGQTIPFQTEWVGQAAASNSAQVRAQVSGVIVERPYVEGTDVKKGAVLYRVDPRTYLANLRSAQAKLVQNRAQLANAERTLTRLKPLLVERAVAQGSVDSAQTAVDEARAAVLDGEAGVASAKKNYEDTFVRAEIDGRAGRAQYQIGAVTAGTSDLLTTVDRVDPIYVYFNPSDQDVLQWRREIAAGRLAVPQGMLDVQVTLADGSVFGDTGKLNFIDVALQQNTGALQLRAVFPNPQRTLLPGQYVRVRLLGVTRKDAIVVPQRAVQQGLNGPFVYVLGDSNKPDARNVAASTWQGTQWIIDSGLKAGDKLIVDGTQKVAPNLAVRPVAYRPEADTTLAVQRDTAGIAPPSAAPPIRDTTRPIRDTRKPVRDTSRRLGDKR
jgi:membrane fusion protein, multidrug efflux system